MKSKTLSVPVLGWIAAVVARRFNVSSGAGPALEMPPAVKQL